MSSTPMESRHPDPLASTSRNKSAKAKDGSSQAFCLRWNNFQTNMLSVFDQLFQDEQFVDVTLACEGTLIKAHKMVLSASSPYFQKIFAVHAACPHPVIIMKDVPLNDLKPIIEFMYKGEINVSKDQIGPLLRVAEALQVRGLADVTDPCESAEPKPSTSKAKPIDISVGSSPLPSKLNRLLKRTRGSSMDSLVMSETVMEPTKKVKTSSTPDPSKKLVRKQSFTTADETMDSTAISHASNIDSDDDDDYEPIAFESVQNIKDEGDDILSDYSGADNGLCEQDEPNSCTLLDANNEPIDPDFVRRIHHTMEPGEAKDGKFVTLFVHYLWQKEDLAQHTVTGKGSRLGKAQNGPLSATKVQFIKKMYMERLGKSSGTYDELQTRVKNFDTLIRVKLNNLREMWRKKNKTETSPDAE